MFEVGILSTPVLFGAHMCIKEANKLEPSMYFFLFVVFAFSAIESVRFFFQIQRLDLLDISIGLLSLALSYLLNEQFFDD